jgi:hypothetical protein
MNRALTLFALLLPMLLTAISLHALPEGKTDAKQQTATAPATETAAAPAAPAAQQDSPLVQAARRAKRLGKASSTPVITNESVKKSKGAHITTTTVQRTGKVTPIALSPTQRAELARNENEAKAEALRIEQEALAAEEARKTNERKARAAQRAEEGYYEDLDDDPARAEQLAQEAERDPDAQEQKPPQS